MELELHFTADIEVLQTVSYTGAECKRDVYPSGIFIWLELSASQSLIERCMWLGRMWDVATTGKKVARQCGRGIYLYSFLMLTYHVQYFLVALCIMNYAQWQFYVHHCPYTDWSHKVFATAYNERTRHWREDQCVRNNRICGRMYVWPNFEYYLTLCLEELRKTTKS